MAVSDELVSVARNAFVGQWGGVVPFDTASLDRDMRAAIAAVAPMIARAAYERGQADMRERAAEVLDRRAATEGAVCERNRHIKQYKAREAAHVARIAQSDARAIRAIPTGGENG